MTKEELLECCENEIQREKINRSFAICEKSGRTSSYSIAENKEQLIAKFKLEDEQKDKKSFYKIVDKAIESGLTYNDLKQAIVNYINADINNQLKELEAKKALLKSQLIG